MIRISILFFALFLSLLQEQRPVKVKAEQLVARFTNSSDTTYVINFWATWCGPCVKELPYFEKLNEKYSGMKVKVLLVSTDFAADYDSKLIRFLKKKKIKSEVLFLDESKPNEFIDKINKKWNGSIPATMIVNNSKKYSEFFEKELTYKFLEEKIKPLLN